MSAHAPSPAPVSVAVVMPSFGEAESLSWVLPTLAQALPPPSYRLTAIVVNDMGRPDPALREVAASHGAVVVDTPYNMGSQEALVFGLRHQARFHRAQYVVTMDADGQDDPRAIPTLLEHVRQGVVVVAKREGRRPEGRAFRTAYALYKLVFRLATQVTPDFGNFAAFTQEVADLIVRSPHFHVTYSLALPKAGPLVRVPVARLPRRAGRSRVGVQGLFDHAVRSALPHLNTIAFRTALFSLVPSAIAVALTATSSFLRIFMPRYAFPNWATIIAFGAATLALQLFTVCLLLFLVASLSRQVAATRALEEFRRLHTDVPPTP